MWYAIYRNQNDDVVGFITEAPKENNECLGPSGIRPLLCHDENALPAKFNSEEEAHEKLKGHILAPCIEFIEL
jgi:hypothetical protein